MSGESYVGVYIPFLSQEIIDDGRNINLKGVLIGNGIGDFTVDAEKSIFDFFFYHGLIPIETYIRNCLIIKDFESNDYVDKKNVRYLKIKCGNIFKVLIFMGFIEIVIK